MPTPLRLLSILLLLALGGACAIGLLATLEPARAGARWPWKVAYGLGIATALAGIVVVTWRRTRH